MIPSDLAFDALLAGAASVTLAALVRALLPSASTAAQRHDAHLAVLLSALVGLAASFVMPKLGLAWLPSAPSAELTSPGALADVAPVPWVWLVYATVACACLARRLAAEAEVRRIAREAPALEARVWGAIQGDLRGQLGLRAPVRLVTHPELAGGATFGILRPVVVLSEAARSGPSDRWRAVLLHELAHVRRRDPLASWIADVAVALFWFLPWAWHSRARLRAEREIACDDLVVSLGARPSSYGSVLLDLLRRQRDLAFAGGGLLQAGALSRAAGGQSASDFEQRVEALLRPRERRGARPARRGGELLIAGCAALLLAAVHLEPTRVASRPEVAVASLEVAAEARSVEPLPPPAPERTVPAPDSEADLPTHIEVPPRAATPAPSASPIRAGVAVLPIRWGEPLTALDPGLDGIVRGALEQLRARSAARGPVSVLVIQARVPLGAASR